MINIEKFKRNIISIADDVFSEGINEIGIKRFISEVINYSEEAFEEYFFSREKDKTILSFMDQEAYLDFSTGYVAQMRQWQQNHAAQVKEVEFDIDELMKAIKSSESHVAQMMRQWQQNHADQVKFDIDELMKAIKSSMPEGKKKIKYSSLNKLGVATVLVIGIAFIIPNTAGIIVGLFAEAIVLTYVKKNYDSNMDSFTKEANKQIEMMLKTLKEKVLNAVINDITAWLKSGEEESDRIEQTFKKTTTGFLY